MEREISMRTFHLFFRVTVHSRNAPPLIEDNGLMVEPNTATDIAIERV